ncbi:4Fe-4S dicluster domain-containing protein [Sansalvadorimonas verongulae]|uniref:4Fe-4S dicluster domain-containing protein n=1 Tax=Sansalvadorimonas verongulae TaxID=2172824 RepID=UPI002E32925A|nr:4Fe-4S dicluster domain-containing protein [Sansalvadorimonas verongulae]MTI15366.1 4Fe-4S dicluster domain-containing protein [Sansalvadorimonas verongulae]
MNKYIFADSQSCIGCRTCEVACVISHQEDRSLSALDPNSFAPRLQLIQNAQVTVPVMCRQCEDAPCARVCPNDAITREDDMIKVNQERCIGCKTCAIACPFGAMNVVTQNKTVGSGLFARDETRALALKCDLCTDHQEGPQCVKVCPTNALRVVTPAKVEEVSANRREAAAMAAMAVS